MSQPGPRRCRRCGQTFREGDEAIFIVARHWPAQEQRNVQWSIDLELAHLSCQTANLDDREPPRRGEGEG